MSELTTLQNQVTTLNERITSAFSDLQFLDLIKTTQVCTLNTNLQTVFNSLNVYESLIYADPNNAGSIGGHSVVNGDYILKGKNNIAYKIAGPSTTTYIPTMSGTTITWSTSGSAGTANLKGDSNSGLTAEKQVYDNFADKTLLPREPIVSFYNASGEEILLQTLPYVITPVGNPVSSYNLTWNTAIIPSIVSYAVVR